jgi:hypothetical protein
MVTSCFIVFFLFFSLLSLSSWLSRHGRSQQARHEDKSPAETGSDGALCTWLMEGRDGTAAEMHSGAGIETNTPASIQPMAWVCFKRQRLQ